MPAWFQNVQTGSYCPPHLSPCSFMIGLSWFSWPCLQPGTGATTVYFSPEYWVLPVRSLRIFGNSPTFLLYNNISLLGYWSGGLSSAPYQNLFSSLLSPPFPSSLPLLSSPPFLSSFHLPSPLLFSSLPLPPPLCPLLCSVYRIKSQLFLKPLLQYFF